MRTLFVHQNFPGQYRHLAPALAALSGHEVLAVGEQDRGPLPGVRQLRYAAPKPAGDDTHRYLRSFEAAVRRGQKVASTAIDLQRGGFTPDLICCHPGWGEGLFLRDVWPNARLLYYWEFYYRAAGADVGFDPPEPVSVDEAARVRTMNSTTLLGLEAADWGHTPTQWQHSRFPEWAKLRISVIHEGVDTDAIRPLAPGEPAAEFPLPDGRVLRAEDEVVSFVARGLEPYRGFHILMRALPDLLARRPRAQVVIVGGDQTQYGTRPPAPAGGGAAPDNWRTALLAELGDRIDLGRVHFTGQIPHPRLLALFRITGAHVYLTYPFVLSWSLLEAMACGALIVGSATAPVQEVVRHRENGLLVDFFDPAALAATVAGALAAGAALRPLRSAARATVVGRYDLRRLCLPAQLALAEAVAAGRAPGLL